MKPERGYLYLAIAALFGGPLLFYLQTRSGGRTDRPIVPKPTAEERREHRLCRISVTAMNGNETSLLQLTSNLLGQGRRQQAERWLRYGALELKLPAVMLFYGDYLRGRGQPSSEDQAQLWYHRAAWTAERRYPEEQRAKFATLLRDRLASRTTGAADEP